MMGYLMDSDEFQVKPAISRLFTMYEFVKDNPRYGLPRNIHKDTLITTVNLVADGNQSVFSVGESIGKLFGVYVNNQLQTKDVNYLHIAYTSNIEFVSPYIPPAGSTITIVYYKSKSSQLVGATGKLYNYLREEFIYDGTGPTDVDGNPIFTTQQTINSVVTVEINGLAEQENFGFRVSDDNASFYLLGTPLIGSNVAIGYTY